MINAPGWMVAFLAAMPPVAIALWSGVLILFLLATFVIVVALRRWMHKDDTEGPSAGFTLGDLRALHRQGQMTDEEFERAKLQMIGKAKKDAIAAMEGPAKKSAAASMGGAGSAAELAAFARELKEKAERERVLREADKLKPTDPPGASPSAE